MDSETQEFPQLRTKFLTEKQEAKYLLWYVFSFVIIAIFYDFILIYPVFLFIIIIIGFPSFFVWIEWDTHKRELKDEPTKKKYGISFLEFSKKISYASQKNYEKNQKWEQKFIKFENFVNGFRQSQYLKIMIAILLSIGILLNFLNNYLNFTYSHEVIQCLIESFKENIPKEIDQCIESSISGIIIKVWFYIFLCGLGAVMLSVFKK